MSQPSLKITHFEKRQPPEDFVFEVWNPLVAGYERLESLEDAMERVQRLAQQVRELWVSKDESLAGLQSPPAPPSDGTEFAEVRITAQAQRHYDVRSFDSPEWSHFRGYISQATEQICGEVGYVLAPALVPAPPKARLQAKSA